jgi:hypothetical protein
LQTAWGRPAGGVVFALLYLQVENSAGSQGLAKKSIRAVKAGEEHRAV